MTIYLNALGMICSLGATHADIRQRLFAGDSDESGHAPLSGLQVTELDAQDEAVPPGWVTISMRK